MTERILAKQAFLSTGWSRNIEITISRDGLISGISGQPESSSEDFDLVLPAPSNLHSHTFQRAMAGLTEKRGVDPYDSFWSWRRLMYRFLDRLQPEHIEKIAAMAFVEMLEAGFGSVAEFHYLHNQPNGAPYAEPAEMCGRIINAAQTTGIGLTLLPTLYCWGGSDRRPLTAGQIRFGNSVDSFAALHAEATDRIRSSHFDNRLGAAAHSLRAVDADGLAACHEIAANSPFHIHAAEQIAEVEEIRSRLDARPIEWLTSNCPLDQNWCIIHATHMTQEETKALADSGAVAGLCPITEANLGDGIFNGRSYLSSDGKLGIGSDSNTRIDLFGELEMLEYSQRLSLRQRAVFADHGRSTGRVLFENTTRGSALAAGRGTGAIEKGQFADLIGLRTNNEWLYNREGDGTLDGLIFSGRGHACITDVWSAGRHVVKEGKHQRRETVTSDFMNVMLELKSVI